MLRVPLSSANRYRILDESDDNDDDDKAVDDEVATAAAEEEEEGGREGRGVEGKSEPCRLCMGP